MPRTHIDSDTSSEIWKPPTVSEVTEKYRSLADFEGPHFGITPWLSDPTDNGPGGTEWRVIYGVPMAEGQRRDTVIQTRVYANGSITDKGFKDTYAVKQGQPDKLWVERREPTDRIAIWYHEALAEEVPLAGAEDVAVRLDTILHFAEEDDWARQADLAVMRALDRHTRLRRMLGL